MQINYVCALFEFVYRMCIFLGMHKLQNYVYYMQRGFLCLTVFSSNSQLSNYR